MKSQNTHTNTHKYLNQHLKSNKSQCKKKRNQFLKKKEAKHLDDENLYKLILKLNF